MCVAGIFFLNSSLLLYQLDISAYREQAVMAWMLLSGEVLFWHHAFNLYLPGCQSDDGNT